MICDDSAAMRRILTMVLSAEADLQIVYQAEHGRDLLAHLDSARPDIVIVDVEMPVMNGIETVRHLRRRSRTLPVIMFGSLTSRGVEATFDALSAGANDFATKPTGQASISEAVQSVKYELISKLRCLTGHSVSTPPETPKSTSVIEQRQTPVGTSPAAPRQSTPAALVESTTTPVPEHKPRRPAVVRESAEKGRHEVVSASSRRPAWPKIPAMPAAAVSRDRRKPPRIIAIGVSTGGPRALDAVLTRLPADFKLPVVIVQHMPAVFTGLLAERLNAVCQLPVREAVDDAVVRPGEVWIARGDYHMEVAREGTELLLKLHRGPRENACRPAVDPLFRSVASVFGQSALGVVLTGMGKDGQDGCQTIHDHGGQVIVQNEATCAVWGMPRAVTDAGLADTTLPLDEIGLELTQRARQATEARTPVAAR
jgi:two-component system chemotaxis response regulator CheB